MLEFRLKAVRVEALRHPYRLKAELQLKRDYERRAKFLR